MPDGSAADTRTVPRSAATRSRMFASLPLVVDAGDTGPMPRPSSVIEILRWPSSRASPTDARVAFACFAVFARASRTT